MSDENQEDWQPSAESEPEVKLTMDDLSLLDEVLAVHQESFDRLADK